LATATTDTEDLDPALVTVVIPARDEEAAIGPCLDAILASDLTELQVIVVDGASKDRTTEVVAGYARSDPRVELLHNPVGIIPVSLNLALAVARGQWFVRVDAHATVPPDYVRIAVGHLRTGQWGAVGGRKDGVGRTKAGRAIAVAMASPFGVGGSTYHHGVTPEEVEHVPFGAYPTALARRLGGWHERLRVNQDFEFDHRVGRAGHRILFDPALVIGWECRQSIEDLYLQYRRYGRGKVVVMALHPGSVKARHLAAPALVAWLALAAAASAVKRGPLVLAGAAAPYLLVLTAATASTWPRAPRGSRRWLAPAFAAMHLGWGWGFWRGAVDIAGGATAAWPRRVDDPGPSRLDDHVGVPAEEVDHPVGAGEQLVEQDRRAR
jgi:glycosyltransferase involved in cell wall biosynthesis